MSTSALTTNLTINPIHPSILSALLPIPSISSFSSSSSSHGCRLLTQRHLSPHLPLSIQAFQKRKFHLQTNGLRRYTEPADLCSGILRSRFLVSELLCTSLACPLASWCVLSRLDTVDSLTRPGLVRPSSAGANHRTESYTGYRKSSATRPTTTRHATSSQYILPTTPASPTRVYGTRFATRSAENLAQSSPHRAPPPAAQLTRSSTAPVLRSLETTNQRQDPVNGNSPHQTQYRYSPRQASPQSSSGPNLHAARNGTQIGVRYPSSVVQQSLELATGVEKDNVLETSQKPIQPKLGSSINPATSTADLNGSTYSDGAATELRSHAQQSAALSLQNSAVKSAFTKNDAVGSREQTSTIENTSMVASPSPRDHDAESPRDDYDHLPHQTRESVSSGRRAQTPVPSNYMSQEKSKSLKSRLRRALSFSSSSSLSELAADQPRRVSNVRSQSGRSSSALYGQGNRSTDEVSVSSTASSASVMLRKMTQGLSRKTKRSLGGIFSGSKSKAANMPGVLAQKPSTTPSVGSISYVNAEADAADRPQSPRRPIFPKHTRSQSSISSLHSEVPLAEKIEVTKAVDNVDGHGSVAFPRLSQEITVEDDRLKRVSMHLERPLPIDLEETPPSGVAITRLLNRKAVAPASGRQTDAPAITKLSVPSSERSVYTGKGILKKVVDPLMGSGPVAHNALPTKLLNEVDTDTLAAFDFSFDPTPVLQDFSIEDPEIATRASEITASRMGQSISARSSPGLQFSPKITIHDTYTATEYDRRGEVATCNRLTPLLAQRIKEELNAYKMDEMNVAEESKVYTHFFA